jgi:hypothetical protein
MMPEKLITARRNYKRSDGDLVHMLMAPLCPADTVNVNTTMLTMHGETGFRKRLICLGR